MDPISPPPIYRAINLQVSLKSMMTNSLFLFLQKLLFLENLFYSEHFYFKKVTISTLFTSPQPKLESKNFWVFVCSCNLVTACFQKSGSISHLIGSCRDHLEELVMIQLIGTKSSHQVIQCRQRQKDGYKILHFFQSISHYH